MNGAQAYTNNKQEVYGHGSNIRTQQDTFTADVHMKNSSATFGDNVTIRSELILLPNQKLNSLTVVAAQLIDSKRTQNGVVNPPALQGGLPGSFISKRTALYSCVFLLLIILGVTTAVILRQDTKIEKFVTRKEWNARAPRCGMDTLNIVPTLVVIHHTVTPECTAFRDCVGLVRSMQKGHMKNSNYCDIGYNFLVGGDGRIYEGRGYTTIGSHTFGYNGQTLGFAFIGDFSTVHANDLQINAALDFLETTRMLGYLTEDFKICGRNQISPNISPGQKLSEDLQHWTRYTADPKEWLNRTTLNFPNKENKFI